jgi:hypothetical protein
MSDADLRTIARAARRERRLPSGATCSVCGETDAVVLSVRPDGTVRCYEHRDGQIARTEADHIAGRANIPTLTVELRGNAHRRVTELRRQLRLDELPPADGDPLLVLAHLLFGIATLLILAAEWLVTEAAARVVQLGTGWREQGPPLPFV